MLVGCSIENTKIFSVEDLKQEIKSLERLYRCKKTSSPSSGPLRPSPPSNARPTYQPVPPTKASRASLTPPSSGSGRRTASLKQTFSPPVNAALVENTSIIQLVEL